MKGLGGVRTNTRFAAGDIQTRVGSRPIDELVGAMSGGIANMRELVDLPDKLNGIKAKIFGNQSPPSPPKLDYKIVLATVAGKSSIYLYFRNPKIMSVFQAASRRVQAFWAKIDAACVGNRRGPYILGITWADEYMKSQSACLDATDATARQWRDLWIGKAEVDLLKKIRRGDSAALNTVQAALNAQMVGTGKLVDKRGGRAPDMN